VRMPYPFAKSCPTTLRSHALPLCTTVVVCNSPNRSEWSYRIDPRSRLGPQSTTASILDHALGLHAPLTNYALTLKLDPDNI
jgi:hypothetical protein